MATSLTAGTLTVKITENFSIGGVDRGGEHTVSFSSIDEISRRIVSVGTTEVDIVKFDTSNSAGTFTSTEVKYIRITNLDAVNFVVLRLDTASGDGYIRLEAGHTFLFGNPRTAFDVDASLTHLTAIKADADTAAVDVEVVIASDRS
jgi:hypothetical protein